MVEESEEQVDGARKLRQREKDKMVEQRTRAVQLSFAKCLYIISTDSEDALVARIPRNNANIFCEAP